MLKKKTKLKWVLVLFLAWVAIILFCVINTHAQGRGGYYGGRGSYGGGYYDYGRYGYMTGIKLDTKTFFAEADKAEAKKSILTIDGAEYGTVDRFDGFWNGVLRLNPGEHSVEVEHPDGRVFRTQVRLSPGQVVRVYVRFKP